jgi:hypothetical protein
MLPVEVVTLAYSKDLLNVDGEDRLLVGTHEEGLGAREVVHAAELLLPLEAGDLTFLLILPNDDGFVVRAR